jgi:hypothetical protein
LNSKRNVSVPVKNHRFSSHPISSLHILKPEFTWFHNKYNLFLFLLDKCMRNIVGFTPKCLWVFRKISINTVPQMHKKAIGLVLRKARTVDTVCNTYCSSLIIRNMWSDGCSKLPRNQDQREKNPQHKQHKIIINQCKNKTPYSKYTMMIW